VKFHKEIAQLIKKEKLCLITLHYVFILTKDQPKQVTVVDLTTLQLRVVQLWLFDDDFDTR
jgi:hypothetical protein